MTNVIVVGAGVIGLSTAIVLRQNGISVDIAASQVSPNTTSDVAAAFWFPYMAFPPERVNAWAQATLEHFSRIENLAEAGVQKRSAINYLGAEEELPSWAGIAGLNNSQADCSLSGYERSVHFETYVIDMSRYMPYLHHCLAATGGEIKITRIDKLDQLFENYDVVVNCTGLGARQLVPDAELVPARGQVVRIKRPAQLTRLWLDDRIVEKFTMVVPRDTDAILGGTYERGVDDLSIDTAETKAIIERCTKIAPEVAEPEILSVACGLRPTRYEVRLEPEILPAGKLLVHNYGHGGAGVTLSWGCALNVHSILTAHNAISPEFPQASES